MGVQSLSPVAMVPGAVKRARALRRGMTEGERRLWSELRHFRRYYGLHVRRQAPIGHYVVDFVIHAKSLVIEIDGEHHFLPEQALRDTRRDEWLKTQGYHVVRFSTGDLHDNFDGCIEGLLRELGLA